MVNKVNCWTVNIMFITYLFKHFRGVFSFKKHSCCLFINYYILSGKNSQGMVSANRKQ